MNGSAFKLVAAGVVAFLITAVPALGQVTFEGAWGGRTHEDGPERGGGPRSGEYQGMPLNDAARLRADSWSASLWTVPEHQCIPHPALYASNFSSLRMWRTVDTVTNRTVAWHTEMSWMNPRRTIWMDDRPHPPAHAPHTWQGFSTGKWEGDMLAVTTTHLKPAYLRRNGLPHSANATLYEYFIRSGDVLTWISILDDPAYLDEPYIKSRNFAYNPSINLSIYPCSVDIEVVRPEGEIPHYLPGTNPFLEEFAIDWGVPLEGTRGGARTMYPEYMQRLQTLTPAKAQTAGGAR